MAIKIYTELDSLWDTRRMVLRKLAIETGHPHFDWDRHFAEVYKRRKYDIFDYPEFGFSEQAFIDRYAKRSKEDWVDEVDVYALPSKLIKHLFGIVRELEFGVGKMLQTDSFYLTINTFPYQLTSTEQDELERVIRGAIKFHVYLDFIYLEQEKQTPETLHAYHYLFKYNFLVSEDMKEYWKRYGPSGVTEVKFIVPELLARKEELSIGMEEETPKSLISKINAWQGGKITIVGIPVSIFDYAE